MIGEVLQKNALAEREKPSQARLFHEVTGSDPTHQRDDVFF